MILLGYLHQFYCVFTGFIVAIGDVVLYYGL